MGTNINEKDMVERYELSIERIKNILDEKTVEEKYIPFFQELSRFIMLLDNTTQLLVTGKWDSLALEEKAIINQELYKDILPTTYKNSYSNPSKCVQEFGKEIGQILSLLYFEVRAQIAYTYEKDMESAVISNELFIQIYNCFEQEVVDVEEIKEIIYWYASDYCDVFVPKFVREQIDPSASMAKDIIMNSDIDSIDYLYDFGEFITDVQIQTAKHLQTMSKDKIDKLANAIVEGFRVGFINTGKDLSKKKSVNVQYVLGFEKFVKRVVELFE